jgi:RNA polymerase sigma-70 factor (ECF subfamily)
MQPELAGLEDSMLMKLVIEQQPNWRDLLSHLIQRHHNSLVARCHAYLRNRHDAEDAAQETELRAFRAIRNFRGDASFRTWLFAIGDRQCHDLARKRSRHILGEHLRSLIEIHEENLAKTDHADEAAETVSKLLSRLPRRERDVLMLRFYLDLPLQEISDQLGLGLSATKMRLYRALESFAALMQKQQRATSSSHS